MAYSGMKACVGRASAAGDMAGEVQAGRVAGGHLQDAVPEVRELRAVLQAVQVLQEGLCQEAHRQAQAPLRPAQEAALAVHRHGQAAHLHQPLCAWA